MTDLTIGLVFPDRSAPVGGEDIQSNPIKSKPSIFLCGSVLVCSIICPPETEGQQCAQSRH